MLFSIGATAQNHPIGSRSITFTDPARNNRQIATDIYYPAVSAGSNAAVAEGQFPVVVLGHGFAMSVNAYQNWREFLVPLGYIVALPTTEGSLLPAPSHSNFGLDLAFVAAQLQADDSNTQSPFFGRVRQRAALMGHSMGGGVSVLGAANNTGIRCIVGMAPAETNPSAVSSAADVTVPALFLQGTSDNVTPEDENAQLIYAALGSGCKAYASIVNGSHCFFANGNFQCDFGEGSVGGPGSLSRADQHQISFAVTEPWLRYFLYDDCDAYDEFIDEMNTNSGLGANVLGCPNEPPTISENGELLESTDAPNYQWYLNGEPIDGETAQQHTYVGAGSYQVATVNVGECPVFSNTIVMTPTGIVDRGEPFRIMQQRNGVVIQVNGVHRNLRADWLDTGGRLLGSRTIGNVDDAAGISLPKPEHQGLKLLRITTDEGQKVFKVF